MRNINELTENDVIQVNSKQELKKVWKLLKKRGFSFNAKPMEKHTWFIKECWVKYKGESSGIRICSGKDLGHCRISYYKDDIYNIIPASEFLKPSKKHRYDELKKALSLVGEELSQFKQRLQAIEHYIAEPKYAKIGTPENVTYELPERWCIRITEENKDVLHKWRVEKLATDGFSTNAMGWYITCNADCNMSKLAYTEISFETFQKYVLKEEVKETVGLEVNRWYKDTREGSKGLFYIESIVNPVGHQDLTIFSYGFTMSGDWSEGCLRNNSVFTKYFIPATESEVFEALKSEAEKRGFKEEVTVNSLNGKGHLKINRPPTTLYFRSEQNDLVCSSDTIYLCQLFHNGQWATIIHQPEAIDFSKAGLLVKSNDGTVLLYTTDEPPLDEHHFSAVVVESEIHTKGNSDNNWLIKMFTLCTEPVTLKND